MNLPYKLDAHEIAQSGRDVAHWWRPARASLAIRDAGGSSMRPSCDSSRLGTEAFQEKSARLLLRSSSAWA